MGCESDIAPASYVLSGHTPARMSSQDASPGRISRAVPLEQLRGPETDVRERRPEEGVKSLAASMGDPSVGQLQDVLVHPVDHEEVVETGDTDELDELFREGHAFRIVDGETRRMAAQRLGWATLDATIVPEPPESTVVAQLDANTERIEMSQAETVRALYDYKQETGKTIKAIADEVGFSPSYMSKVFSLCEAPDWIQRAWQNPDHSLETSHARAVRSFLTENTLEMYAEAGRLDEEEARKRCVEDAKLMIGVQAKHDLQVSEFQARCKRKKKETRDSLQSSNSVTQERADGTASTATDRDRSPASPDYDDCAICGNSRSHDHRKAVPVCEEDYGMLSSLVANDDYLMANPKDGGPAAIDPQDDAVDDETAANALAAVTPLEPRQALGVVEEVRQQAQRDGTQNE